MDRGGMMSLLCIIAQVVKGQNIKENGLRKTTRHCVKIIRSHVSESYNLVL
jgi:hypothetical protein